MKTERLTDLRDQVLALKNTNSLARAPGLSVYHASEPTQIEAMIYEPLACLILQGEKETMVGEHHFHVHAGQCFVVGHDLPVLASITKASKQRPYLSLIIRLELSELRSLEHELEELDLKSEVAHSIEVAPVNDSTIDVLKRYLNLLIDPVEAQVLLPLVRKELYFRLLMSESGAMLRSLLNRDSHASNIGRAIEALRKHFKQRPDVTALAKSAGMSPSAFHRHFKAMTRTTPLQYQKDLRLTEARRLLRAGQSSVSSAAFEVGYESTSQFSREYSRKFGAPPRADRQEACSYYP